MEPGLEIFSHANDYDKDKALVKKITLQLDHQRQQNISSSIEAIRAFIEQPHQGIKLSVEYKFFAAAYAEAIRQPSKRDLQTLCGFKFDSDCKFNVLPVEIMHTILMMNPLLDFNSFKILSASLKTRTARAPILLLDFDTEQVSCCCSCPLF